MADCAGKIQASEAGNIRLAHRRKPWVKRKKGTAEPAAAGGIFLHSE